MLLPLPCSRRNRREIYKASPGHGRRARSASCRRHPQKGLIRHCGGGPSDAGHMIRAPAQPRSARAPWWCRISDERGRRFLAAYGSASPRSSSRLTRRMRPCRAATISVASWAFTASLAVDARRWTSVVTLHRTSGLSWDAMKTRRSYSMPPRPACYRLLASVEIPRRETLGSTTSVAAGSDPGGAPDQMIPRARRRQGGGARLAVWRPPPSAGTGIT